MNPPKKPFDFRDAIKSRETLEREFDAAEAELNRLISIAARGRDAALDAAQSGAARAEVWAAFWTRVAEHRRVVDAALKELDFDRPFRLPARA